MEEKEKLLKVLGCKKTKKRFYEKEEMVRNPITREIVNRRGLTGRRHSRNNNGKARGGLLMKGSLR